MSVLRFPVAVVMDCLPIASPWASERWQPCEVVSLVTEPEHDGIVAEPLAAATAIARWRFDGLWAELHPSEGEGYWLNLTSPAPKAFVMWRAADDGAGPPVRPHAVTLSYNEAARMLDAGEQVEGVPLAPQLLAWLERFVAAHYKPEPRKKIRRNDPLAAERDRAEPR